MNIIEAIKSEIPQPYGKPTDIIGFGSAGKNIAKMLLPIIGQKEICFFDEKNKSDPDFHYLDFAGMLEKTAIMIFTVELPEKYYDCLDELNKDAKIFLLGDLPKTAAVLQRCGVNHYHKVI